MHKAEAIDEKTTSAAATTQGMITDSHFVTV